MTLAWLLTLLALGGVSVGILAGKLGQLSDHFAAAGGGLLFGIAAFWLIPEVAQEIGFGFPRAVLLALGLALLFALTDRLLAHRRYSSSQGVIWPLLAATAIHSLLDGWSVRLLSARPLTNLVVAAGLALHKVPEGAALGWVTRRAVSSPRRAFLAAALAESFTLIGAFSEPALSASGAMRFGPWWSALIVSLIAGGFLFLALHSLNSARQRRTLLLPFFLAVLLAASFLFLGRTL